jgi:hypothetical protein
VWEISKFGEVSKSSPHGPMIFSPYRTNFCEVTGIGKNAFPLNDLNFKPKYH